MVEVTSQTPRVIEPIRPDGRTLARAGLMRGWAEVLRRAGVFEAVGARLTPDVRELLAKPPQPTEWVDVAHFECVAQAVLEEAGEASFDELFLRAARNGWEALITRWAGSIVWVLGPSPANVLKHAPLAAKRNTVGFSLEWNPSGDSGGELVAIYPFRDRMHPAGAWGTSVACQIAADAVGVTVVRARPVIEPSPGGGLHVRVHVSW